MSQAVGDSNAGEANHFSMQVKNQFLPAVGHPLQSNWQFWFYQRQSYVPGEAKPKPIVVEGKDGQESYMDQLKPLGQISTIEHFFNFYVHMKRPSAMPREVDLFFFRDQEVPMWEVSKTR